MIMYNLNAKIIDSENVCHIYYVYYIPQNISVLILDKLVLEISEG